MMKRMAAIVAGAALISGTALIPPPAIATARAAHARPACRDGKNRHLHMTNATSYTIRRLYGSVVNVRDWQENVLHDMLLRPGQTINVNWDDGRCQCAFDIKAVYSDGDSSIASAVDVCRLGKFRFTE